MSDLDHDDIRASQQGDHEAYRRLMERYEPVVSRLMWCFSQQIDVCEELVQETFVEAYMSLGSFRFQGPFEGWLKRIATRVGYRHWKQRLRDCQAVSLDEMLPIEAPEADAEPAHAAVLASHLLNRLVPAERLVLTLLYFDKCSTKEIAQRMGWSRAMVKMRAYRARQKLKTLVKQEGLNGSGYNSCNSTV